MICISIVWLLLPKLTGIDSLFDKGVTRLYDFFKNAHNINAVAKIQPKNLRNTDESRYPFAQLMDPVVKPRGFGVFFIKSSVSKKLIDDRCPLFLVQSILLLPIPVLYEK